MIADLWSRIDYPIQLMLACLVFMIPIRKREHFVARTIFAGLAILTGYFIFNANDISQMFNLKPLSLLYWASYIIFALIFTYISAEGTMMQAIYCTACACAMQHIAFDVCFIIPGQIPFKIVLDFLAFVIIYVLFYYFFARTLATDGALYFRMGNLFPVVTIIASVWILSLMDGSSLPVFASSQGHRVIYRIMDCLCCFYILWVQANQNKNYHLRHELDFMDYLLSQQKKQYELTSETVGNINRKCHDLKHQVRALRRMTDEKEKDEFLKDLEKDILIYDTYMKTGNEALDIVLMEKGLICKNNDIQWTCMVDGFKLDFMRNEDIYAIFGNAFDNAIMAAMQLEENTKRIISTTMRSHNQLLSFQIQNYFQGELELENGLPKTTKKNKKKHGYGMKSIQYNAEKYNGTITVNVENGIFILRILIPIPK